MAVDDKTREALDIHHLSFPPSLPVVAVQPEEYVDSSGDNALRVWVVLDESADEASLTGEAVLSLKWAIHESLLQHGITLFPYIFLVKESERHAALTRE